MMYDRTGVIIPHDGVFCRGDGETCSSKCSCRADWFQPVCGDDGLTYFSPCYAGCSSLLGHGVSSALFTVIAPIILMMMMMMMYIRFSVEMTAIHSQFLFHFQ